MLPWTPTLRANARFLHFAVEVARASAEVELRASLGTLPAEYRDRKKRTVTAKVLSRLGVRVHARGHMRPQRAGRLVVANHRTAVDIGVLMSQVGGAFLSRDDVAEWPLAGRLAKHAETIFVERGNRRSGAKAIRAIRRRLKEGKTVIVFPEGTTHAGDEVRRFARGAFVAAQGTGADILPVGLAYPPGTEYVGVDFLTHVRAIAARPHTPVGVQLGPAITCEGSTDELAALAQKNVQTLTFQARELISG